jgi:hypothetical protein
LTYGQAPQSLTDLMILPCDTNVETVSEFITRMHSLATRAQEAIASANLSAEHYANKSRRDHQFGVGDKVLLSTKYFLPDLFRERKR